MRILLAFVLCAFAIGAGAQVYRWTDEQGRVHITDTPPPASAKNAKRSGPATGAPSYLPQAAASPPQSTGQEPYVIQQAKEKHPVTLYTTPVCEGCDAARNLLNARGVPFKEISLIDATTTAEFKKNVSTNALPTIVVGNLQQGGFEEGAYHRLLDDAGYPATGILPPRKQSAPTTAAASPAKPSAPQAKPAAAEPTAQPSGPYAPGATAEPTEQPSGPYAPGAAPPPPPTKKK